MFDIWKLETLYTYNVACYQRKAGNVIHTIYGWILDQYIFNLNNEWSSWLSKLLFSTANLWIIYMTVHNLNSSDCIYLDSNLFLQPGIRRHILQSVSVSSNNRYLCDFLKIHDFNVEYFSFYNLYFIQSYRYKTSILNLNK